MNGKIGSSNQKLSRKSLSLSQSRKKLDLMLWKATGRIPRKFMDGQKGKNVDIIIFKNAQILTE